MTRLEHMEFSKKRALELCDKGDVQEAYMSMVSDLNNHPETRNHSGIQLGMMLMMSGNLSTVDKMRKFIEDFN